MSTWFVMMLTLTACLRWCLAGFSIAELLYYSSNRRFVRNESLRSAHTLHLLERGVSTYIVSTLWGRFVFSPPLCIYSIIYISVNLLYSLVHENYLFCCSNFFIWPSGALPGWTPVSLVAPPFYFKYFIFWHYKTLQAHCVFSLSQS